MTVPEGCSSAWHSFGPLISKVQLEHLTLPKLIQKMIMMSTGEVDKRKCHIYTRWQALTWVLPTQTQSTHKSLY